MNAKQDISNPGQDLRTRILSAARKELIAHGVAGARIDRISARARTSKERVYFYFRSKDEIVREVAAQLVENFEHSVRLEPDDVPGFIGALFDFYSTHSDDVRLWLWFLLEAGDRKLEDNDPRLIALKTRVAAVKRAQEVGSIDAAWHPILLLNLVASLAMSRAMAPLYVHELGAADGDSSGLDQRHRQAVIDTCTHIVRHPPAAEPPQKVLQVVGATPRREPG